MSADRSSSLPLVVSEKDINFAAQLYFSPLEMAEARRMYQESGSYAEAIAYLVGCGDDLRRMLTYMTIPGGKVHIP